MGQNFKRKLYVFTVFKTVTFKRNLYTIRRINLDPSRFFGLSPFPLSLTKCRIFNIALYVRLTRRRQWISKCCHQLMTEETLSCIIRQVWLSKYFARDQAIFCNCLCCPELSNFRWKVSKLHHKSQGDKEQLCYEDLTMFSIVALIRPRKWHLSTVTLKSNRVTGSSVLKPKIIGNYWLKHKVRVSSWSKSCKTVSEPCFGTKPVRLSRLMYYKTSSSLVIRADLTLGTTEL